MDDEAAVCLLAREISMRLEERPDVVDIADGVLRCSPRRRCIDATAANLQRVLALLLADGLVERRTPSDSGARTRARGGTSRDRCADALRSLTGAHVQARAPTGRKRPSVTLED
jgi:hypothetical protein